MWTQKGQKVNKQTIQVLLGLARYDGDSRRDKATVVKLATTFLKAQQVSKLTMNSISSEKQNTFRISLKPRYCERCARIRRERKHSL